MVQNLGGAIAGDYVCCDSLTQRYRAIYKWNSFSGGTTRKSSYSDVAAFFVILIIFAEM